MEQSSAEITKAILNEWNREGESVGLLPSSYQINERVVVFLVPEGKESFPGISARVTGVHFYPGKVKYDVELFFSGDYISRIYNVDSVLVAKGEIN